MSFLFEITKNGKTNYLYGTLHVNTEEVCSFSEEAKSAFEKCSYFVLESKQADQNDINHAYANQFSKWMKLVYEPSFHNFSTPKMDVLLEKEIHDAVKACNISPVTYALLFVSAAVKKIISSDGLPLDRQLEQQAIILNKQIASLDDPSDLASRHLGAYFSYEEQMKFAIHSLANVDESIETIRKMIPIYVNGTIDELTTLLKNSETDPISTLFNKSMIHERNAFFAQTMETHLERGDTFFAIGCFHLDGVISLLKQQGYTIKAVQEGKQLHQISDCKKVDLIKSDPIPQQPRFFNTPMSKQDSSHNPDYPLNLPK